MGLRLIFHQFNPLANGIMEATNKLIVGNFRSNLEDKRGASKIFVGTMNDKE